MTIVRLCIATWSTVAAGFFWPWLIPVTASWLALEILSAHRSNP